MSYPKTKIVPMRYGSLYSYCVVLTSILISNKYLKSSFCNIELSHENINERHCTKYRVAPALYNSENMLHPTNN